MSDPAHPAPVLTDGTVTLRPHAPGDAAAVVQQCTDPDTLRWTTVPRPYSRADAEEFVATTEAAWRRPDGVRGWAVEWSDGAAPRFAGSIDLRPVGVPDAAEIGFGLHPDARGHGVAARAVRLAAAYAFDTGPWGRPLARIHWRAVVGNWASRRVAWSTGFTMHGTLPGVHVDPDDHDRPGRDVWLASLAASGPMRPSVPWLEPVVLEGDGIRLRPWADHDVEQIEVRADPAHWVPPASVLRRETFATWLARRLELMASGTAVDWCVADLTTDRVLGSVTVFSHDGPLVGDVAELGYQLNPGARGRGVATAAARLAVAHALTARSDGGLGLRRLVARTAADNTASNRVLESVGFALWGREHAVDFLDDGALGDTLHWELPTGRIAAR